MIRHLLTLLIVISPLANGKITAQPQTTQTAQQPQTTSTAKVDIPKFSGERAMIDLMRQVEGGPRLPDSPGMEATRQLIKNTLTEAGWEVHTQDFTAFSPQLQKTVPGQNIFAIYPKGTTATCIISAHYDTRPFADMDPDPARRQDPVPGANDGASGVAVLLELGRLIPQTQPTSGICLAFWDLEDHGASGNSNGFCLGSRYFASNLPAQVKDFQWGVNLDMVADIDMQLPMEGFSLSKAPKLTSAFWNLGHSLYPEVWTKTRGPMVYDDHMPFLAIGRPYIDVIDFDYAPWHTTADTPDKCSPRSLEIVGDTTLIFIVNFNQAGKNF